MTDTDILDVEYAPVDDEPLTFTEPDTTQLPVPLTPQFADVEWEDDDDLDLERYVNTDIYSNDDTNDTNDIDDTLATYEIDTITDTQPQLGQQTHTQPLTTLWSWLSAPTQTKTATKRANKRSVPTQPDYDYEWDGDIPDYGGRCYFVLERDPSESDETYYLRYAYMVLAIAEGIEEWSEVGFWEWESNLSGVEREDAIQLGYDIATGQFSQRLNADTQETWHTLSDVMNGIGRKLLGVF
ncbi:MAG: hypothetical protein AAF267_03475 [Deinococcota bacterium]